MECLLHFSAPTAASVPTLFQADGRSAVPTHGTTQANGSLGKRTAKQQPAGAPRAQTTFKAWDAIRSILLWVCKTVFCMDCREIEAGILARKLDRLLQRPDEIINRKQELLSLQKRLGELKYKIDPTGIKEIFSGLEVEKLRALSEGFKPEEELAWIVEILDAKINELVPKTTAESGTFVKQAGGKGRMQESSASKKLSLCVKEVFFALLSLKSGSSESELERAAFALMKLSFILCEDTSVNAFQTEIAKKLVELTVDQREKLQKLSSDVEENKVILTSYNGRSSVMLKVNHDSLDKAGKIMALSEQNKNLEHVQENVKHILNVILGAVN